MIIGGDLGQQPQYCFAAAPWPYLPVLYAVKNQAAYAITRVQRTPGNQAGQLGRQYGFKAVTGAKKHAAALIYHDQHRALPFFTEQFGVGTARSGGDAPVNGADVITWLVNADFFEINAATTKIGLIGPCQLTQRSVSARQVQLPRRKAQRDQLVQVRIGTAGRYSDVGH